MVFQSIYPYSQEVVAEYEVLTSSQIDDKLATATKAFSHWRHTSFEERATYMLRAAAILREKSEEFASLITLEMGKSITEARGEVLKSALPCEYYAHHAADFLKSFDIQTDNRNKIVYQPTGAVFAVMPWNFPFWQVFRYATAALMAGNVTLLKHAPNVSGCSLAIEQIFREAGFPEGVFQSILIDIADTEQVIAHPIVQGITLTGSERAGSSVAALAGKHLKKSVLELGGSDPFLILDDADVLLAAKTALQSRLFNAGQTCISAKRFLVTEKNKEAFESAILTEIQQYHQGDPMLETTKVGPLARTDLADNLERQLKSSLALGGRVVYGGERNECNFAPTLMADVSLDLPVFREETFGPLVTIYTGKDEQELIRIANDTPYGLGASVWSADREKAEAIALQIETGNVFINAMVKSDPRLPFGGIKRSGYGRELGEIGMKEFLNMKTIAIY